MHTAVLSDAAARWHVALSEAPRDEPLCLALANTREWRRGARPRERLADIAALLQFARAQGLVDDAGVAEAGDVSVGRSGHARAELEATLALREAIFRVFSARAAAHEPPAEDVQQILATFNGTVGSMSLELHEGALVPRLANANPLDVLRRTAALSAVALLTAAHAARVKECADDRGCARLFLDLTRNGSRRFCASRECGNRARQAAFRARHRHDRVPEVSS